MPRKITVIKPATKRIVTTVKIDIVRTQIILTKRS